MTTIFKRSIRLYLKNIHRAPMPKIYICDPTVFFQFLTSFSKAHHKSYSSEMNFQILKSGMQSKSSFPSWAKLLTVPISFFILDLFKGENIQCSDDFKAPSIPYLGCSIRSKGDGMQIIMIKSGSPAEKSGLKVKDVITEIDGKSVSSINEYYAAIGMNKGSKKVKVRCSNDEANSELVKELIISFD